MAELMALRPAKPIGTMGGKRKWPASALSAYGLVVPAASIQNIKHGAVGGSAVGTSGDCISQDGPELDEVGELSANTCQMRARDLMHVCTCGALWPPKGQQGANLLKGESEVAGTPDEGQCSPFRRPKDRRPLAVRDGAGSILMRS